ncbi:L-threonylcarbamoyladenylate synthase [Sphingobacterium chuzhouense]|uniref:Threonylcarbamoyl-AMP synthase n=1 Tax=Sphingobacterium chuzhouense TaxID=1742264 RepID=A0ABR7XMB3_9SPHI|nr:L-threonylcarbamoyladenylate synthase [Sphingobacterium chuzhouense]MBD1420310.1 threonylcarbamoyl-AMP synthase [Sphingobacterium chuzhouense]
MLLRIYEENPNPKFIEQAVDVLKKGGVIIYPTDTVYGIGCDITNQKAIERVCKIRGLKPEKSNLSFICYDLTDISQYTKPFDTAVFRVLKKTLPGPFTFIFNASSQVPKLLSTKKKTVGIRVPDNNIVREIVKELGNPIVTSSIRDEDDIIEYSTDPELIYEKYQDLVDLVIDGGYGGNVASTIVDVTSGEFDVIREGKGDLEEYL